MIVCSVVVDLGVQVVFSYSLDDHITIGADCDELGAQIEEYIL